MYYRPRERRRHPLITLLLWLTLLASTTAFVILLAIYVGYINYEPPTLTQQFEPTPTPTRPAVLYIGDGDTYFAEGKLREAINAYEEAIQLDPDNDIPYIRQSRLLVYTRETAKAVDRAEKAVLLNPTSPENLAYYCRALDWEARYGEALDACSCAIELAPDYAEGYAFLSEVYADQGNWRLAQETAQQAIDANYQSMNAHHNMGYAFEVQGRYEEALKYYENAITLAPKLGPLHVDVGRSYYALADYETAADYFKTAIRLSPTEPEGYNWLGWTYYTTGDFPRAIDALEQSIGVNPTYIVSNNRLTSSWGNLATVYYVRQNFEEAIELYPKAIDLAERQFARRARQVELLTEVETLSGVETIPVLRGQFVEPNSSLQTTDTAQLEPIPYKPALEIDSEQTCAATIVQSIKNEELLAGSTQTLTTTQTFSQATGTATLDFNNNLLSLTLNNLPPTDTPYEIQVTFWPDRTDSVGFIQPTNDGNIQVNIQFEEKLQAPIEYYYTLGLAYAYLDPPVCNEAIPWLLRSLEIDSSGGNPAWAGLRICPTSDSPPTPIPTWTPTPDVEG